MSKIINLLTYLDKGSYGYVFYDKFDNIYKITNLVTIEKYLNNTDNMLERNNLSEIIMLNFFNTKKKIFCDLLNDNFIDNNNDYDNEFNTLNNYQLNLNYNNLLQANKSFYFKNNLFENTNNYNYIIINKFHRLKKIKFPLLFNIDNIINKFKNYAEHLLIAVATLHHNGFLHGDISPNNIMIDFSDNNPDGINKLVLIDLGGVKPINSNYYYNTCTLTSRCPEDLETNIYNKTYKSSGVKSDIWSIGIFLSQILLGECVILKLYKKLCNKNYKEEDIEKCILTYYKSIINIEIEKKLLNKLENNKINYDINNDEYKELIRLSKIVEKMLIINPNNRIDSIEKIYEEIFNKKFEYNFKKEYNYEYPLLKNEKFLNFRNNFYYSVIIICLKVSIVIIIPFLIDLLDRFFNELLANNIDIYTFDISILESITLSSICLSSLYITFENINMDELIENSNFINTNIAEIQKYIIYIIITLNYDIYRPFNIFGNKIDLKSNEYNCKENFTINDTDFKCDSYHKLLKLDKIYSDIIINNIIEVTPEYYINRLIND
jgi:serine/threonine protein kinase